MASDPDLDEVRRIIAENVEASFGLPARAHSALVSRAILDAAGSAEQLAQIAAADEQLAQRLAQADARAGSQRADPGQPPEPPRPLIAIHNAQTGDIRAENIAGRDISIHYHYHGGRRRRGVRGSNRRAAKRNEPGPDPTAA